MRTSRFQAAAALFDSEKHFLKPAVEIEYDLFTEYRQSFLRFRFCRELNFYVSFFSDQYHRLGLLQENIIIYQEHERRQEYSHEIVNTVSSTEIVTLPLPRFAPFFTILCHTFINTKEAMATIAVE